MAQPCKVKWCGALATRGEYCPVHAKFPQFDSRSNEEAYSSRDGKPQRLPSLKPKKDKPVPVDERPIIRAIEE